MSREDLITHPDYQDHHSRYKLVDQLDNIVGEWSAAQKRDDLVALLLANNIPCAPVREIDEVAADPELPARHIVRSGTMGDHDDIKVLGSAIKMSGLRGDEIPPLRSATDARSGLRAHLGGSFDARKIVRGVDQEHVRKRLREVT